MQEATPASVGIEANVADRIQADELSRQFVDLLRDELPKLPSDRSRMLFWSKLHDAAARRIKPAPACVHCRPIAELYKPNRKPPPSSGTEDIDGALAIAEEIQAMAEELPDEGYEFGESVSAKAADIAENIEEHNRVTPGQMEALENMQDGLSKWFHD